MRKTLAVAAAVAAAALAFKLRLDLGLRWQDALIHGLATGLCLTALLAFVQMEAWPAFTGVFTALALYDGALLVKPPLPGSLVMMYSVMSVFAVAVYLTVYEAQLKGLVGGFADLLTHPGVAWHRWAALALAPLWFAAVVLAKSFPELSPPLELRIVHPEPPNQISVKGKDFDMAGGTNPFRKLKTEDPKKFAALVEEGKVVYYKNCFYCHGDNLDGKGHYAVGFNPKPANFEDVGTIAMLQESFVFWRVAKGGPGLPKSSHPWSSAMPVWEDMLSEDEMWKAILWIYEGTGHEPRTFAPTGEGKK